MGLTRTIVKLVAKNKKIESYDTYLFVGPHPDDIEVGAGATVSKLTSMGKKVYFLICTDGRYGKENIKEEISCSALASLRKEECLKAVSYLGVEKCFFLDLSDGGKYEYSSLLEGIATIINEVKPDIVFAPDPDIINECHQDHLNVGRAVKELSFFANFGEIMDKYLHNKPYNQINLQAIAFYMTNKPNVYVKTRGHLNRQFEALYLHKSQYAKEYPATQSVILYLKLRAVEFGIKSFSIPSEGFRVLNRTTMHCCPEGY